MKKLVISLIVMLSLAKSFAIHAAETPSGKAAPAECPAGWAIKGEPDITPRADVDIGELHAALVDEKFAEFDNLLRGKLAPGDGKAVFHAMPSGFVSIDGVNVSGVSTFEGANLRPNGYAVLARGLGTLKDSTLIVKGDPLTDIVYLDGCLDWQGPLDVTGDKGISRYTATDIYGNTAAVEVTQGMQAGRGPPWRIAYWLKRVQTPAADVKEVTDFYERMRENRTNAGPGGPVFAYTPDDAGNIARYRKWAATLSNKTAAGAISTLALAMEKRLMPTEFAQNTVIVSPLFFDTGALPVIKADKDFDCKKTPWAMKLGMAPLVIDMTDVPLHCGSGRLHTFLGSGGAETVSVEGHAYNLFVPGGGNDAISTGKGTDIVVLEKGWGHKTVNKTCPSELDGKGQASYVEVAPPLFYAGILLPVETKDGFLVAKKPYDHSPAAQAGLSEGDVLLAVDGKDLKGLPQEDAVALIRGPAGTTVKILVRKPGEAEPRLFEVTRRIVNMDRDTQPGRRYRVDIPHKFTQASFVLFGAGISPGHMEQEKPGEWRNTATGDSLKIPACFNFVYLDETPEERDARVARHDAQRDRARASEKGAYPLLAHAPPARQQDACEDASGATAILKNHAVVVAGVFTAEGRFMRDKIYRGFRRWPVDFAEGAFAARDVRPGQPALVLAQFSGGKAIMPGCSSVLYEGGSVQGASYAEILSEAAIYEAETRTGDAPDPAPDDRAARQLQLRAYQSATAHARKHRDYLSLLELSRDKLFADMDTALSDQSHDLYAGSSRKGDPTPCQNRLAAEGAGLTEDTRNALHIAARPARHGRGGGNPEALRDFGDALLHLKEYPAALYALCSGSADDLYMLAAFGAGRADLLNGAPLRRVNGLKGIDLSGMVLRKMEAGGVWEDLKVTGADFTNASFARTKFVNVNLRDAKLDLASYSCSTEFPPGFDPVAAHMIPAWDYDDCRAHPLPKINLSNVDIKPVAMVSAEKIPSGFIIDELGRDEEDWRRKYNTISLRFKEAAVFEAKNARLGVIECSGCRFLNADFSGSTLAFQPSGQALSFIDTIFRNADLRGSDINTSTFTNVDFAGANLSKVNFGNATFLNADLSHALLEGARFEGAKYDARTRFPAGFSPESQGMQREDKANPR